MQIRIFHHDNSHEKSSIVIPHAAHDTHELQDLINFNVKRKNFKRRKFNFYLTDFN